MRGLSTLEWRDPAIGVRPYSVLVELHYGTNRSHNWYYGQTQTDHVEWDCWEELLSLQVVHVEREMNIELEVMYCNIY